MLGTRSSSCHSPRLCWWAECPWEGAHPKETCGAQGCNEPSPAWLLRKLLTHRPTTGIWGRGLCGLESGCWVGKSPENSFCIHPGDSGTQSQEAWPHVHRSMGGRTGERPCEWLGLQRTPPLSSDNHVPRLGHTFFFTLLGKKVDRLLGIEWLKVKREQEDQDEKSQLLITSSERGCRPISHPASKTLSSPQQTDNT